jgi:membrane protein DedA with SNARE-associated domain
MPVAAVLSTITDALTTVVGDYGVYAVFLLMLVDAVFPAASEAVMVYGGAVAAGAFAGQEIVLFGQEVPSGFWAWLAIALAGTLGYIVGSIIGWAIGLYGGRPFAEQHGRWLHLSAKKLDKADRWFEHYGDWFVLFGRVTPVLRSFVAIPAGIARMALGRYTVLTIPGSAVWCFGLAAVGWAVGANYESFNERWHYLDYAVVGAILIVAAVLVLRWRSSRLAARAADSAR